MIAYDDNIAYKYATGRTTLVSNSWYYIVGTYDSTDKNIRVFVNGMLDGTPTNITTFSRLLANQQNVAGALRPLSNDRAYNGAIAAIRIYDKCLTAAQIRQNFDTQKGRYGL